MRSLWLRIEELDQATGSIALFDVAFPEPGRQPIAEKPFSRAPTLQQAWKDREAEVASAAAPAPSLFDDFGDDLLGLLEPFVLAEWAKIRTKDTRTYLEVRRPAQSPPAARQLADLPWEYLAKKKPGGLVYRYFADTQNPILRVRPSGGPIAGAHAHQLNALIVTGEAVDWKAGGFPGDDVGAVLREMQRRETCAHAELLQVPDLDQLQPVLDRLLPDIIHFTGHGELSPTTQRPALRISKPGDPWWWDTAAIHTFFSNQKHKPRLVVLNACDTAAAPSTLYSVLEALMETGIPAVVAAQAPVGQAVTSELSEVFYRELLAGNTVDMALALARAKIGQGKNGTGWQSRDWGLPVLSVSIPPEELFPPRPIQQPDPVQALRGCAVLKEFMRGDDLPAPFVGLSLTNQRWKALRALRTSNCLVIKGPPKGGKSWLVMRTLRDAVHLGHRVKYVAVCGGGTPAVNYLDLLSAIVDADTTRAGSLVHKALDDSCFKEFHDEVAAKSQIERIVDAFERGLQQATKEQELTIVLDEFQRNTSVAESLPMQEFRKILLPLWLKIAQGSIPNLRLIIVIREDLFDGYGLAELPGDPIQLQLFKKEDVSMLFKELCRFYRDDAALDAAHNVALVVVKESQWNTDKLEFIGTMIKQAKS